MDFRKSMAACKKGSHQHSESAPLYPFPGSGGIAQQEYYGAQQNNPYSFSSLVSSSSVASLSNEEVQLSGRGTTDRMRPGVDHSDVPQSVVQVIDNSRKVVGNRCYCYSLQRIRSMVQERPQTRPFTTYFSIPTSNQQNNIQEGADAVLHPLNSPRADNHDRIPMHRCRGIGSPSDRHLDDGSASDGILSFSNQQAQTSTDSAASGGVPPLSSYVLNHPFSSSCFVENKYAWKTPSLWFAWRYENPFSCPPPLLFQNRGDHEDFYKLANDARNCGEQLYEEMVRLSIIQLDNHYRERNIQQLISCLKKFVHEFTRPENTRFYELFFALRGVDVLVEILCCLPVTLPHSKENTSAHSRSASSSMSYSEKFFATLKSIINILYLLCRNNKNVVWYLYDRYPCLIFRLLDFVPTVAGSESSVFLKFIFFTTGPIIDLSKEPQIEEMIRHSPDQILVRLCKVLTPLLSATLDQHIEEEKAFSMGYPENLWDHLACFPITGTHPAGEFQRSPVPFSRIENIVQRNILFLQSLQGIFPRLIDLLPRFVTKTPSVPTAEENSEEIVKNASRINLRGFSYFLRLLSGLATSSPTSEASERSEEGVEKLNEETEEDEEEEENWGEQLHSEELDEVMMYTRQTKGPLFRSTAQFLFGEYSTLQRWEEKDMCLHRCRDDNQTVLFGKFHPPPHQTFLLDRSSPPIKGREKRLHQDVGDLEDVLKVTSCLLMKHVESRPAFLPLNNVHFLEKMSLLFPSLFTEEVSGIQGWKEASPPKYFNNFDHSASCSSPAPSREVEVIPSCQHGGTEEKRLPPACSTQTRESVVSQEVSALSSLSHLPSPPSPTLKTKEYANFALFFASNSLVTPTGYHPYPLPPCQQFFREQQRSPYCSRTEPPSKTPRPSLNLPNSTPVVDDSSLHPTNTFPLEKRERSTSINLLSTRLTSESERGAYGVDYRDSWSFPCYASLIGYVCEEDHLDGCLKKPFYTYEVELLLRGDDAIFCEEEDKLYDSSEEYLGNALTQTRDKQEKVGVVSLAASGLEKVSFLNSLGNYWRWKYSDEISLKQGENKSVKHTSDDCSSMHQCSGGEPQAEEYFTAHHAAAKDDSFSQHPSWKSNKDNNKEKNVKDSSRKAASSTWDDSNPFSDDDFNNFKEIDYTVTILKFLVSVLVSRLETFPVELSTLEAVSQYIRYQHLLLSRLKKEMEEINEEKRKEKEPLTPTVDHHYSRKRTKRIIDMRMSTTYPTTDSNIHSSRFLSSVLRKRGDAREMSSYNASSSISTPDAKGYIDGTRWLWRRRACSLIRDLFMGDHAGTRANIPPQFSAPSSSPSISTIPPDSCKGCGVGQLSNPFPFSSSSGKENAMKDGGRLWRYSHFSLREYRLRLGKVILDDLGASLLPCIVWDRIYDATFMNGLSSSIFPLDRSRKVFTVLSLLVQYQYPNLVLLCEAVRSKCAPLAEEKISKSTDRDYDFEKVESDENEQATVETPRRPVALSESYRLCRDIQKSSQPIRSSFSLHIPFYPGGLYPHPMASASTAPEEIQVGQESLIPKEDKEGEGEGGTKENNNGSSRPPCLKRIRKYGRSTTSNSVASRHSETDIPERSEKDEEEDDDEEWESVSSSMDEMDMASTRSSTSDVDSDDDDDGEKKKEKRSSSGHSKKRSFPPLERGEFEPFGSVLLRRLYTFPYVTTPLLRSLLLSLTPGLRSSENMLYLKQRNAVERKVEISEEMKRTEAPWFDTRPRYDDPARGRTRYCSRRKSDSLPYAPFLSPHRAGVLPFPPQAITRHGSRIPSSLRSAVPVHERFSETSAVFSSSRYRRLSRVAVQLISCYCDDDAVVVGKANERKERRGEYETTTTAALSAVHPMPAENGVRGSIQESYRINEKEERVVGNTREMSSKTRREIQNIVVRLVKKLQEGGVRSPQKKASRQPCHPFLDEDDYALLRGYRKATPHTKLGEGTTEEEREGEAEGSKEREAEVDFPSLGPPSCCLIPLFDGVMSEEEGLTSLLPLSEGLLSEPHKLLYSLLSPIKAEVMCHRHVVGAVHTALLLFIREAKMFGGVNAIHRMLFYVRELIQTLPSGDHEHEKVPWSSCVPPRTSAAEEDYHKDHCEVGNAIVPTPPPRSPHEEGRGGAPLCLHSKVFAVFRHFLFGEKLPQVPYFPFSLSSSSWSSCSSSPLQSSTSQLHKPCSSRLRFGACTNSSAQALEYDRKHGGCFFKNFFRLLCYWIGYNSAFQKIGQYSFLSSEVTILDFKIVALYLLRILPQYFSCAKQVKVG